MTHVFEQLITSARLLSKGMHKALDDSRACVVVGVRRFARLKKHIRVLSSPAENRLIRSERPAAMVLDGPFGNQAAQYVISDLFYFCDLVRGSKTIKEMQK